MPIDQQEREEAAGCDPQGEFKTVVELPRQARAAGSFRGRAFAGRVVPFEGVGRFGSASPSGRP